MESNGISWSEKVERAVKNSSARQCLIYESRKNVNAPFAKQGLSAADNTLPAEQSILGARENSFSSGNYRTKPNPVPLKASAYIFQDNMDGANDTTALKARGYIPYYRGGGPQGTSATWYQGVSTVFAAYNGPATGYVAANFNVVTGTNDIDSWLVLPAMMVNMGDTIAFWSRSPLASIYPDSIKVMYSAVGDSTPEDPSWVMLGEFKVNTAGIWEQKFFQAPAAGVQARFAIRYAVIDGGPLGANSNYIGIDQIDVFEAGTSGGPGGGGCPDYMVDGSFEGGSPSAVWTETSTNFGTPLCTAAGCGTGGGTGPNTGTWWAWFGGIAAFEEGTLTQSIVIPNGDSAKLIFQLEVNACDSSADFLEVTVDGNLEYFIDGGDAMCGTIGYAQQEIDMTAYADGNAHTIEFHSIINGYNAGVTNFFVDDVVLEVCTTAVPVPDCIDTVAATTLPTIIPDGDTAGVTVTVNVSGISGTLGVDVLLEKVCVNVSHTWVGDMYFNITAPSATMVDLYDTPGVPATQFGCSGDDIQVCFMAGTGNDVENVCGPGIPSIAGDFTATNGMNLSAINAAGGSPNGAWTLFFNDWVTPDEGTITLIELHFKAAPSAAWTPPAAMCSTDPAVNLDNLVTGAAGGTWSGQGVTGNMFDPSGLSGNIPVTYVVTDISTGCSDSLTQNILVYNGLPGANFTAGVTQLTVSFTNTSTNGVSYSWDFGDGSPADNTMNPSHTYAASGSYLVTLTVTNPCGTSTDTMTVVLAGCPDQVLDGGMEGGTPSAVWTEASTNFGTPLCNAGCGLGGGTGPHTGLWWAWFGGIAAFEEGTLEQTMTLPDVQLGTATLKFWLEVPIACDNSTDFMDVLIDGTVIYSVDGNSPLCGIIGYSQQTVDVTAYADGNPHTLTFHSIINGTNGTGTNFFVDDITLETCVVAGINTLDDIPVVSILPNPATDVINLNMTAQDADNVKVEISNSMGQNVLVKSLGSISGRVSHKLDVSKVSSGVYFVRISSGKGIRIEKIVIE